MISHSRETSLLPTAHFKTLARPMQRLCTNLRALALQSRISQPSSLLRLLHQSSPLANSTSRKWSSFRPLLSNDASPSRLVSSFRSSPCPLSLMQVRHVSSRERAKRRKPMTPRTSKIKKIKLKPYSSYKSRFRTMNDGNIRRWKEGKRHNAHLKSKKSKRRLRQPGIVPAAYAKVMKKLNFRA